MNDCIRENSNSVFLGVEAMGTRTIEDLRIGHFFGGNSIYNFAAVSSKAGAVTVVITAPNGNKYTGKASGGGYNKLYAATEAAIDALQSDGFVGIETNKVLDTSVTVF